MIIQDSAREAASSQSDDYGDHLIGEALILAKKLGLNWVGEVHVNAIAKRDQDLLYAAKETLTKAIECKDEADRFTQVGKLFIELITTDQGRV